jgi:hypothetical protein
MKDLLKFGEPNAKLKKMLKELKLKLKTFTLPAGHTCPAANECLSRADKITGKIKDGPNTLFRCFAASAEATYPSLRKMVWHNLGLLKDSLVDGVDACADLICASLPDKFDIMREFSLKTAATLGFWLGTRFPGSTIISTSGAIWPPKIDIYIFGPFMVKTERLYFLTFPKYTQGPF